MMIKSELKGFMESVIAELESEGRYSTAHVYRCALKAALAYEGDGLCLENITSAWLSAYQEHLRTDRQLLMNTVSTYMRMLRAVYNRAVDAGLVPFVPHLFRCVFTGRQKNHRRALEGKDMRKLLAEEPAEPATPSFRHGLRWARACLELMLRFHGLSFVDLAHLRKSDLRDGHLYVCRRKTGIPLCITVSPEALALIHRYAHPDPASPYLLDILDGHLFGKAAHANYCRMLRLLNLRLSQLSRKRRLGLCVSSYCARHTWATAAKYCGVPVEVISEALGHSSVTVTEGYLKQFDWDVIDRADRVTMRYIFGK
ncbi:tyrosine-type recombinase/integrase [Bacteroides sp.]|uniref:tyrosine-type recombinase/integrase n=1 Tax=Bacteroides sp. TaxID=29523 RepID=UPI003AB3641D